MHSSEVGGLRLRLLPPAMLQIGISPTIPLDAKQLLDIPLSGEAFCRFAQTDGAPKLF